jgi:hypothetical protein
MTTVTIVTHFCDDNWTPSAIADAWNQARVDAGTAWHAPPMTSADVLDVLRAELRRLRAREAGRPRKHADRKAKNRAASKAYYVRKKAARAQHTP